MVSTCSLLLLLLYVLCVVLCELTIDDGPADVTAADLFEWSDGAAACGGGRGGRVGCGRSGGRGRGMRGVCVVEVHSVVLCGHHVRQPITTELSTECIAVEVCDRPLPVGYEV